MDGYAPPKADLAEEHAGSTRPGCQRYGEPRACATCSPGLSAQDGRSLWKSGTVQAVQHVVDGARRFLPGVGHGLNGLVHADRVQMELVDKKVVRTTKVILNAHVLGQDGELVSSLSSLSIIATHVVQQGRRLDPAVSAHQAVFDVSGLPSGEQLATFP